MPLSVNLDDDLKRRAKVRAAELAVSLASVIREFLEKWLEETDDSALEARAGGSGQRADNPPSPLTSQVKIGATPPCPLSGS